MITKERLIQLLQDYNRQGLIEAGLMEPKRTMRLLISLAYDKESVISWRAIESIGIISREVTKTEPEITRNFAQRLLWMMREESGNNPWSAPEMLGEMVRNTPEKFEDIAQVIASFHDEEILRRGVLRAMVRIGEIRQDLVQSAVALIPEYLDYKDAVVRAYAVMLSGILKLREHADKITTLIHDTSMITLYENGELKELCLGDIARESHQLLVEGK